MTESSLPLPKLARRARESHKGNNGSALIIGGSRGMVGAAALAGMAALRCGAGLVRVATSRSVQPMVASFEPSYMTIPLADDGQGQITLAARDALSQACSKATVVACGPGLGQSDELSELVAWLYQTIDRPMVVDADALNALAGRQSALAKPGGPRILTPHPGEFARLAQIDSVPVPQREKLARELATKLGVVVLLKGHRTVITDGARTAINSTGNPGMATGGMGDVLTGVIAALAGQGLAPLEAQLGAHVHGRAGDMAAAAVGPVGFTARDVIGHLPAALAECIE